jgi:leucyl aminopeptidase
MNFEGADEPVLLHLVIADELPDLAEPLQRVLSLQGFTGEVGQRAIVTGAGLEVFAGVGPRADRHAIRVAVGCLGLPASTRVQLESLPVSVACEDPIGTVHRELVTAGYECAAVDPRDPDGIAARAEALAVKRARRWTNASGAALPPARFADIARDLADETGLSVDVWDAARLESEGCRAILAVGQGSIHEARLADVRYEPADPIFTVTLVGKGITFDSGGLSLKSPAAMAPMRMDKVGVATVLAVMSVLPELGLPVRVRGVLPLAENMVGSRAVRPGDVVVGRSGVPITIMDTDFEGRVLLSDALTLACEEPTDAIIDIAALTYQVAIALGNEIGGMFASTDALAHDLVESGRFAGEDWWRLPLAYRYLPQVVTVDGVKNHPESDVGRAITAALFLQRFVSPEIPWAHLDITGPAWSGPASGPGATGFGVRTLLEFLRARSRAA